MYVYAEIQSELAVAAAYLPPPLGDLPTPFSYSSLFFFFLRSLCLGESLVLSAAEGEKKEEGDNDPLKAAFLFLPFWELRRGRLNVRNDKWSAL